MDLQALLTLMSVPGVGIQRARRLVDHFGSPEEVLKSSPKELASILDIGPKTAEAIPHADAVSASLQLKKAEEFGARCVTLWDDDYPPSLKDIYDPPLFLFVQGDLDWIKEPAFSVVGTRKLSKYGRSQTRSIVSGLARHGLVIVSGMARGADSEAHKAALEVGGRTVAVLGCGLDITYPPENKKLRETIAENGAVISEFFFETPPEGKNFPRRNRIISGLSLGTLVVEAGEKSGALITAAYAVDQNREAFALPGDVNRLQSRGCNQLIRTGRAHLAASANDILEVLNTQLTLDFKPPEVEKIALSGDQSKLYHNIDADPIYIDELAREADMTSSEALTILLQLEMMDVVRQLPGKMYVRA